MIKNYNLYSDVCDLAAIFVSNVKFVPSCTIDNVITILVEK